MKYSVLLIFASLASLGQTNSNPERKIFVYGGQITKEFIKYTATLTNKENPKICFLPTAKGDDVEYINYWFELCSDLDVEPSVLKVWINSYQRESWENILTSVDAIIVGGGNTLNMLAIWKAQGIDIALKQAYDQGIVLAGGSAGSLCWFDSGTTDSRPQELSIVQGLGYLNFSNCPHYSSELGRRPLYHANILEGKLSAGYASDDRAGLLFVNEKMAAGVALDTASNSYFVSAKRGKISEEKIYSKIIE